ncbi:unnamed protein product, partial [Protopolystoma xenopodis]
MVQNHPNLTHWSQHLSASTSAATAQAALPPMVPPSSTFQQPSPTHVGLRVNALGQTVDPTHMQQVSCNQASTLQQSQFQYPQTQEYLLQQQQAHQHLQLQQQQQLQLQQQQSNVFASNQSAINLTGLQSVQSPHLASAVINMARSSQYPHMQSSQPSLTSAPVTNAKPNIKKPPRQRKKPSVKKEREEIAKNGDHINSIASLTGNEGANKNDVESNANKAFSSDDAVLPASALITPVSRLPESVMIKMEPSLMESPPLPMITITSQAKVLTEEELIALKPYQCDQCLKRYSGMKSLKNHKLTHSDIKPHKCSICEKAFHRADKMRLHEISHLNVKPYECATCKQRFTRSDKLKIHHRTHTGVRPYACSFCPKRFTRSDKLKIHERIHTKIKPYECQHCGKCFARSDKRRLHERTHMFGPKPSRASTGISKKLKAAVNSAGGGIGLPTLVPVSSISGLADSLAISASATTGTPSSGIPSNLALQSGVAQLNDLAAAANGQLLTATQANAAAALLPG